MDHPFKDAKDVTIHGRAGTTAQQYAQAFGLRFELMEETTEASAERLEAAGLIEKKEKP